MWDLKYTKYQLILKIYYLQITIIYFFYKIAKPLLILFDILNISDNSYR